MDTPIIQHIVTSLIQINWQAFWWSGAIVGFVALLQFCRVLPRATYSRWRMGLLLAATLIPFFLCAWTWISVFLPSSAYEVPFFGPGSAAAQPLTTLRLPNTPQNVVIACYVSWLVIYPILLFLRTSKTRRELRDYAENAPSWSEVEGSWQSEIWADLQQRYSFWRRVRIIEIDDRSPHTAGLLRPVIIMPEATFEGSMGLDKPERFRAVLAHELAHIRYHNIWTFFHRFAVWIFPLPQFPVWMFDWLRRPFARVQMDTEQAKYFVGVKTAGGFEMAERTSVAARLTAVLKLLVLWISDAGELMGVEFEHHADFVAVWLGAANHEELKKALWDITLYEAQNSEWDRLKAKAEASGNLQQIFDAISRSKGLFGLHPGRFMNLPEDTGISLWTKIGKTAAGLAFVYPVAVILIPALLFLAETGSELARPPAPGFAATVTPQPAPVPSAFEPRISNPEKVATTPSRVARSEPSPSPSTEPRIASSPVRTVAHVSPAANSQVPSIPPPPRTPTPSTQPQSFSTSAQDAVRNVAAVNEQQRILQANAFIQQRANASIQRQQDDANRSQRMLDSVNRGQSQMQAAERSRQTDANFTRANQQMQQTSMRVDQVQNVQNFQQRQQSMMQSLDRVSRINEQGMRQQNILNNSRVTTPYIPSSTVTQPRTFTPPPIYTYTPPPTFTQPRVYTPPMNTYTPPRVYTPPPTPTYTPPPAPYIPPPPPRIR